MMNQAAMDMRNMLSESIPSLGAVSFKVRNVEATRQAVVAAIALKRYQLKHGNYPASLDSLVPEFVSAVPFDPVDGQPLRYRLNPDGTFRLYSIGENGKDDGGNPHKGPKDNPSNYYWQNNFALDWVWPQPASPEEIQKYYVGLSKR
jgi:hypothetical protein